MRRVDILVIVLVLVLIPLPLPLLVLILLIIIILIEIASLRPPNARLHQAQSARPSSSLTPPKAGTPTQPLVSSVPLDLP